MVIFDGFLMEFGGPPRWDKWARRQTSPTLQYVAAWIREESPQSQDEVYICLYNLHKFNGLLLQIENGQVLF